MTGFNGRCFILIGAVPGWTFIGWEMRLVLPYPPIEITSANWRRVRDDLLLEAGNPYAGKGEESRRIDRIEQPTHLILASWGRASNSSWVAASGGEESSAWTVVGVGGNVLHRSNDGIWLNVDILLLQVIYKDSQADVGLYLLHDRVVPQEGMSRGLQQHQGSGREGRFWLHRQNAARPSRDLPGLRVRTNLGPRPMRVVLLSPGRRSHHMKGANLRGRFGATVEPWRGGLEHRDLLPMYP